MANTTTGAVVAADQEIVDRINAALGSMSVNSLADRAAIPQKTLARRLKGDGLLTVRELSRIAEALNTNAFELIAA